MTHLNPSQLKTLWLCVEEECSVIELWQELQTSGGDLAELKLDLIATLEEFVGQGKIGFFLDEFAASTTQEIDGPEALARLALDATWDRHSQTQLHVRR